MEKFARIFIFLGMLISTYLFIFDRGNPFYSALAIFLIGLSLVFDHLFAKENK